MVRTESILVAGSLLVIAGNHAHGADRYQMIELLYPSAAIPFATSDSGLVVGYFTEAAGFCLPSLWSEEGFTVLPSLGLDGLNNANTVTSSGLISGWSTDAGTLQAVKWTRGGEEWTITIIDTIGSGSSRALDHNDGGTIVGGFMPLDGSNERPFIYTDGRMLELVDPGDGDFAATGINNLGQATISGVETGPSFVWLPQPAYGLPAGLHQLPDLGGEHAYAAAISDSGRICGSAETREGVGHAVAWIDMKLVDLTPDTTADARATDLNERGQIVGTIVAIDDGSTPHGFVWENGALHDLNDLVLPSSKLTLGRAHGINDRGWIVGQDDGAHARPLLLVPHCPCLTGDINGDGTVDVEDLVELILNWGL